ncbi:MAG: hypothetical protein E6R07_03165 [Nevskiaceae bacterium]|nr:MAG: hypothetical protein E6R07_03165 [Nevskiaceae bacterium]
MSQRRPIVQVVANLKQIEGGAGTAAQTAIQTILGWLRNKQRLNLPAAAEHGEPFEIDAAEGQPVSVVRSDTFWSLQFDRFDGDVPGRIWRTEASVGHSNTAALVGVRLAVIDANPTADSVASVPRVIGDLIRSPGLYDYGVALTDSPSALTPEDNLSQLISLLENKQRTRPVVVFSSWGGVNAQKDAREAAQRLAGLAHIYVITDKQSRLLTELLGKEFSVWKGAIRTYNPGFNPLIDEITQHPPATREWLNARFGSLDRFYNVLVSSFATRTVRDASLEEMLPPFRAVKQAILQKQIASLSSASKTERERLLEQNNILLEQQIQEKTEEFNLADAEVKQAEVERDQYRAQLSALRGKIESLENRIGKAALQIAYPNSLDSLDEWTLKHLAGRLILLNRAVRAARKSPFNEPMLVYKCLERLARDYVDARRSGAAVDGLFNDLGVHLERTGDPARLSQWKEEYFVPHRTKSEFLAWHLKRGSDKNETNTLRIYFFYDEDDEQVIVGHLPGHLTNEKT